MKRWDIKDLTLGGLFTALIAVGAFLKITIPVQPVPMHFTLQFFFVLLAALILGSKRAFASVITYLVIGLCGLPIFATGGGPAYLLKPTFGFLIGFAAAAFVIVLLAVVFRVLGTSRGLCLRNVLFLCVQQFCPRRECRLEACVYQLFPPDGR